MFDVCSNGIWGGACDAFHHLQDFISWFDQRVNLNEGLIALIAIILGIAIQNENKRWTVWARRGLLAVALLLMWVSTFEPSYRPLWGVAPYYVEVPSLFRNSRGTENSKIAWDDAENNSVQLSSGTLTSSTPLAYLARQCLSGQADQDLDHIAGRDVVDRSRVKIEYYTVPKSSCGNACIITWEDNAQSIAHYEVFLVTPAPDRSEQRWAHLHARIKKPTNVLVGDDYNHMLTTLTKSAGINPESFQDCE